MTVLSYYCPWCKIWTNLTSITPDIEKYQNKCIMCVACFGIAKLKNHRLEKSDRESYIKEYGLQSYGIALKESKEYQKTIDMVSYYEPKDEK